MNVYIALVCVLPSLVCSPILAGEAIANAIPHVQLTNAPSFVVVVENVGRPLIWISPKRDDHGQEPVDVVRKFLEAFQMGQTNKAEMLCFSDERDKSSVLNAKAFPEFFDIIATSTAEVRVTQYAIRGKSGYWRIEFTQTLHNGEKNAGSFSLKVINGAWRIQEKPHWLRLVKGEEGWTVQF